MAVWIFLCAYIRIFFKKIMMKCLKLLKNLLKIFSIKIKSPKNRALNVIGGAKEDRTPDPLLAKQVLSQLSYNPMYINSMSLPKMVGLNGLEPATSPLSGVRSSHLSYRPNFIECFNIISTTAPSVNTFL